MQRAMPMTTTAGMRKAGADVIMQMLTKDNWLKSTWFEAPQVTREAWAHIIWVEMEKAAGAADKHVMPVPDVTREQADQYGA
jgi:hypothetical protein